MGGLGAMYYNGKIGAKDAAQAQQWWRQGALAGDGRSMAGLALLYETGEGGMRQDTALSLEWLGKAVAMGDARALYRMGMRLREGQDLEKDLPKSFEMFRRSAEQDLPAGQYMLGWSYFKGLGVAQNEEKAAAEFAKAAEGGIANAMNDLGALYQRGDGMVPQGGGAGAGECHRERQEDGGAGRALNTALRPDSGSTADASPSGPSPQNRKGFAWHGGLTPPSAPRYEASRATSGASGAAVDGVSPPFRAFHRIRLAAGGAARHSPPI
jgi:TPR repeat protein